MAVCARHNESAFYREAIKERSSEAIANIAITMIHQEDVLLRRLIFSAKQNFIKYGGIREEMTRARMKYRKKNK